ncbi:hypothetical protein PQ460_10640 [Paenibacillus sp. KACC 21273]|uniref:hypothetical protein n=1 Tax=Paenibacillus sp. KACC 21273 TaxID=3025665 RepID=UPI00236661A7|nr:hypothetical protein [Paenibacillus sp. KACC 21273]WDF52840.1 hypothetical protein PQ460_10640 [Paenibacillus sp. KACC 21273]
MPYKSLELSVIPYNEMWIDCVNNNLMGILMANNSSYQALPCSINMNYSLTFPQEAYFNPEMPRSSKLEKGVFVPNLTYEVPSMDMWLAKTNINLTLTTIDPFEMIYDELLKGNYLFVDLDRFYFPGGVDYQKNHNLHPSFIYGFDCLTENYLLIEDCVQPGKFEPYQLHKKELEISFIAAQTSEKSEVISYTLLPEAKMDYRLDLDKVISNLKNMLSNDKSPLNQMETNGVSLWSIKGISCLKLFSKYMDIIFPQIRKWDQKHLIALTLPSQMQKRNLRLLTFLEEMGAINSMYKILLEQEYISLNESWEKYRHKIYKYIVTRKEFPEISESNNYFKNVKNELYDMANNEERVTKFLLDILS